MSRTTIILLIGAVVLGVVYVLSRPSSSNSNQSVLGSLLGLSPSGYSSTLQRPVGTPSYVRTVAPASSLPGVISGLGSAISGLVGIFRSPSPSQPPTTAPSGIASSVNLDPNAPINQGINLFDPQYSADPTIASGLAADSNVNYGTDPLTGDVISIDPSAADMAAGGYDPSASLATAYGT